MEKEGGGSCNMQQENQGQHEKNFIEKRHCVVPDWEREFTLKVGGLTWERFVEAKKNIDRNSKVIQWNDSAGEEAFQEAKNRFWCEYIHLEYDDDECLSDSYVYIDNNFDWYVNPQEDVEDENLMIVSKEEFSQNGGTNNRILDFVLHPVVKVKRYAGKKLLSRRKTTAPTATSMINEAT